MGSDESWQRYKRKNILKRSELSMETKWKYLASIKERKYDMGNYRNKKYNDYEIQEDYVIMYTNRKEMFLQKNDES